MRDKDVIYEKVGVELPAIYALRLWKIPKSMYVRFLCTTSIGEQGEIRSVDTRYIQ